jgi:hypothetical protein
MNECQNIIKKHNKHSVVFLLTDGLVKDRDESIKVATQMNEVRDLIKKEVFLLSVSISNNYDH